MAYQRPNKEERNRQFLVSLQEHDYNLAEPYAEESIDQHEKFLIVCEGENTERLYFKNFPVVNKQVVTVYGGYGGSKIYLVEEAAKIAAKEPYAQHSVWCVFDFDVKNDNPYQKQDYDNAIMMAHNKGYRVAFSNDCFELWAVLHYKFIQNQHHRTEYYDMLADEWKLDGSYESMGKEEDFAKGLYDLLLANQSQAIRNAKKLLDVCNDGRPYHQMNPCTTVFQLVSELNKYLRR